ncbi:MAG: homoserine O-acetyltransferase [Proteobacteria bacterium]|nr:homoserine O-acetyltransferase [Pseudomonadota bacterium]MBU1232191.1 homoserine O-acetyltransferase [Pseudomonadota bacterium]MBU1417122.1 homoserine O-acetyltransferase [Pseudomonadota bacterium]MBU1453818.1 homoserine O-acetyltransferase [Pseudomonadota bacterium]
MTASKQQPRLVTAQQFYTFAEPPDQMLLESGARLGPVTIAYETYGQMSADRDNVILITHAFSGDSHVAGYLADDKEDAKPGWWDSLVGPGKGIDTDSYFVICSNILGSCMGSTGPASINPATDKPYGLDFPMVTIGDMVAAQKALMDHLQINSLLAVIGGSVGGMQVLEWCIRYPDMVRSAVPLATTMRHSALAIAFNEVARQSIMADPNWNKGDYYGKEGPDLGLAIARMIGHVTYLSDEAMRRKFGRRLQDKRDFSFGFDADFQVESYLRYQGSKFVRRFDANALLYITKAADYFDLVDNLTTRESIRDLSGATIKFLVISYTSDWLYPTYQARELVQALKRSSQDVSFCEINADCGHDAFLLPDERLTNLISGFLKGVFNG